MHVLEDCSAPATVGVEELSSCPWCGADRFRHKWTSFDRLLLVDRQTFGYQQCRACGIIFQSPRPVEEQIHRYYPNHYGPYFRAASAPASGSVPKRRGIVKRMVTGSLRRAFRALVALTDRAVPRAFAHRYGDFYQPSRPGLALLDFGCGSDQFLNTARSLGWHTTGMDFTESAVAQARASGHRALVCGAQAWDELADESFHFVRLSHVLEHLYHPRVVLRRLASKMAPGALLHLGLPNPRCLSARLFGSRWFSLDCPRHIMLFSVRFLRRELPEHGFRIERVLHEDVTKDFARSWAYRQIDRGRARHDQLDSYVQDRLLNDGLAVPMRLLAGLGCGERFHLFARKD